MTQQFKLIDPELVCESIKVAIDGLYSQLEVVAEQESAEGRVVAQDIFVTRNTDFHYDNDGAKIAMQDQAVWGFLELLCNITGRSARFLMPVADGHALQSINHAHLPGLYSNPLTRIITARDVTTYHVAGAIVFEDRKETNYSKEYSTLRLIQIDNDGRLKVIHTFFAGHGTGKLIETITAG